MREAMLYAKCDDGAVDCALCSHRCHIPVGGRGICRVRQNQDGTLIALTYDRAITAKVDPIEKKPLFHFMPGARAFSVAAAGCNFTCSFCQNWEISQSPRIDHDRVPGDYLPCDKVVQAAVANRCRVIAYTYTEPTVFFEYAHDTARMAKETGLANVFVTNGFQTPETIGEMAGLIDAANVDLKSFRDEFYRRLSGGRLEPVKESIRLMHEAGIHVEVTTLLVTGENDADDELRAIAGFLAGISPDIPWHVSRFHPDYQFLEAEATPVERVHAAVEIAKDEGVNYVYAGNLWGDEHEKTRCPACRHVVIDRIGYQVSNIDLLAGACPDCRTPIAVVLGE